jgi:hypothetical protein
MIFARIRIEPKFQVLRVKNHGQLEVMNDDVSIGFYNVKDESFIYLESIQDKKDESQVSFGQIIITFFRPSRKHSRRIVH